jgi:geranylgeranyl diphosphate synthase type II
MNFQEALKEKAALFETYLRETFTKGENRQKKIYEAMEYSLLAGGKRIRPVLALAACELFGGGPEKAAPFAAAVEMIHAYSLIHDDLPCMDDDDLRRGRPANHKVFGEAMALLAGDALLTRAFEFALSRSAAPPEKTLAALRLLAEAAGTEGMIGGQVIDMESEGKRIGAETLLDTHRKKTGALIAASARIGALSAGADARETALLGEYAAAIGLAFQIKDDILDVTGDAAVLGKAVGGDAENGKTTFAALYGPEGAENALNEYTRNAVQIAESFGEKGGFLKELALYLCAREK